MICIPSNLPSPRYTQSKMALFTAMKTEHRQAGKKAQSISRLFTGAGADEIIARCQPDVRCHPILERGGRLDATSYGNSHTMAKEEDISLPSPLYGVLDHSAGLVRVWVSVS